MGNEKRRGGGKRCPRPPSYFPFPLRILASCKTSLAATGVKRCVVFVECVSAQRTRHCAHCAGEGAPRSRHTRVLYSASLSVIRRASTVYNGTAGSFYNVTPCSANGHCGFISFGHRRFQRRQAFQRTIAARISSATGSPDPQAQGRNNACLGIVGASPRSIHR